jgi:hypothetical protein
MVFVVRSRRDKGEIADSVGQSQCLQAHHPEVGEDVRIDESGLGGARARLVDVLQGLIRFREQPHTFITELHHSLRTRSQHGFSTGWVLKVARAPAMGSPQHRMFYRPQNLRKPEGWEPQHAPGGNMRP